MAKASKAKELANQVNAALGKGAVRMGSDKSLVVTYMPTGVKPVDDLLGGGFPRGRFIEIYGDYSSLKSYVALHAIGAAQARGETAALIDTEHAYDPEWAASLGVDVDELILQQPETGEEAIDIAEVLIRNGVDLIVFDSVAATLPRAEAGLQLSGDKNVQPARLAQLMSIAMRKLTAANKNTAVVWINQTRLNVGITFGNPETIPGGKSLPYYASIRVSFRKSQRITESVTTQSFTDKGAPKDVSVKRTRQQIIKATVEKSKLSKPHNEVFFTFDFESAEVDTLGYLINRCVEEGLITKSGQSWKVKGKANGVRGFDAFRQTVTVPQLEALLRPSPGPKRPLRKRGVRKKVAS